MIDFERSKYKSWSLFHWNHFRRSFLVALLRTLVRWGPMKDPEPGYTVIIACNYNLRMILDTVLQLIVRQDTTNLRELMVAFELTEDQFPESFKRHILERFPSLPITFLTYDRAQSFWARAIDWPWLYSWMSWCKGISLSRTRYVLIHDYDALPIRRDFFEERYRLMQELGTTFVGVSPYLSNGIVAEDGFASTWELMIDAQVIRDRFQPVEIFNRLGRLQNRLVEFDTFLYAQWRIGSTTILPVELPADLVHLGQVISQHTQVLNGRQKVAECVLFAPYMLYVAGAGELMQATREAIRTGKWPMITYCGKTVDLSKLDRPLAEWMTQLAEQVERTLVGETRLEVRDYFKAIQNFAERERAALEGVKPPPHFSSLAAASPR
jgi:hypothetical protein